mgnify:CR=1 FL=1
MIIREKDRVKLIDFFSRIPIPVEVWAFGSRVDGTAHSGSDLDLVIRTRDLNPVPSKVLFDLRDEIRESTIPILVEVHDWAHLPESFQKNISEKFEVFFSNLN